MNRVVTFFACIMSIFCSSQALAAEVQVRGKVLQVQGHLNPACRMLFLKRNDNGATMWFRLPDLGADQSMLSVALTGLSAGLDVQIDYDQAVTTGCGTEPRIVWISLFAAGAP